MINTTLKNFLLSKHGVYNFNGLVEYMESTNIDFKLNYLVKATAIATIDSIYFDFDNLDRHSDKTIYYIVLHEIGHFKRMEKYSLDWVIKMLSIDDFDEYFNAIVGEEVFADRFSCFIFNKLNKTIYPWNETQQLNLSNQQDRYKPIAKMLFGKVKNNEETYYDLINQVILK